MWTAGVHEATAARAPPVRLIELVPATAVTAPPQAFVRLLGVATTSPAGRLSVKPIPVSATVPLGLVIVKVRDVVPLSGTLAAVKALPMVGGATTVTVAVFDAAPAPVSLELTAPEVLFLTPAVLPVMLTAVVHEALAARAPPVRLIELLPATAVTAPPHVLARPLG